MNRLNRVLIVVAIICIGLIAAFTAYAIATANHADLHASNTDKALAATISREQAVAVEARMKACASEDAVRALFDDLDDIIRGASKPSAALDALSARIHAFTDTNPQCDLLTPAQRQKALAP